EVVTAAVTDTLQGVILREQRDARARRSDARAERGREPADAHLDAVPAALEQATDAGGGMLLVIRQLGVGVDLLREREEIAPQVIWERHDGVYCYVATFPIFPFAGRVRIQKERPRSSRNRSPQYAAISKGANTPLGKPRTHRKE